MTKGFISDNEEGAIPSVDYTYVATTDVVTPGANQFQTYIKSDHVLYGMDSSRTEYLLGGGSVGGGSSVYRIPAAAVATSNVTVATPGASIDGYSLSSGDRVLLTGQSAPAANGLWTWTGAATPMTRTADYESASTEMAFAGVTIIILNGTTGAGQTWRLTTTGTITIDTDSTSWSQNPARFTDSSFTIQDNVDQTKKIQFQVSALTTATTRTVTWPDASDTVVYLTTAQNIINKNIDSSIIGGTTPAAITGTTITASSTSGLLMSQSAETTLQTILDMTPKTASQPHLKLQYNSFANAGGGAGTYNHGYFLGYNTDFSSGGTPVSSKPVWLWGMEDNYFDNLGDGLYGTEAYLRYVSPDQTSINLRPFYIRIPNSDTNTAKNAVIKFDIGAGSTGQFSVWQDATHLIDIQPAGTSLRTVLTMFNNFAFTPTADSVVLMAVKNSAASSNVLVVDSSSQRVGINANVALGDTPQNKLHLYYGDMRIEQIAAPTAATGALAGAGAGNVNNGAHIYKVTYVNVAGETTLGTSSNTVTVTDLTTNGQVSLTAIPTATAGLQVTSRNIYRTKAGGSTYFLLTTLADNTTTTYTDNTADASLAATDMTSRNNTTAGTIRLGTSLALRLFTNDTSVGVSSMANITSAINVTAVGTQALQNLTTGNANNAFGASAGATMTTGAQNNLFGVSAGTAITNATHNVIMGHSAGNNSGSTPSTANAVTTGGDNTFIGYQTGYESATQRTFAIAIGSGASVDASQTCIIGGTTTANSVDLGLGRTTATTRIHATKLDSSTNVVLNIMTADHKSSGTTAANFGTAYLMTGTRSTTNDTNMARWRSVFTDVTASWLTKSTLSTFDSNAERDVISIAANGSVGQISFLSVTTPVSQQVSGANLTNNVTAGGTTDQIDDFVGSLYATDAATIRNDIYQLARKVKQLNDGSRAYGLFT